MAVAVNAATPAYTAIGASVSSQTTGTFSPPANSWVFLLVSVGDNTGTGNTQSVTSVTDSLGSHLSWALCSGPSGGTGATINAQENATLGVVGTGATAEVWAAACPSAQTNMTVTPSFAWPSLSGGGLVLPIVVTGVNLLKSVGAVAVKTAASGAAAVTLTTVGAGSLVFGCAIQWNSATGPTAASNNTLTINGHSADNGVNYYGVLSTATIAAAKTSVTFGTSAPTGTTGYNIVAVEVLAAPPTPGRVMSQAVNRAATF